MNCLKCGRDIAEDQLFCESCLEVMDQYPVKSGSVVGYSGASDCVTVPGSKVYTGGPHPAARSELLLNLHHAHRNHRTHSADHTLCITLKCFT